MTECAGVDLKEHCLGITPPQKKPKQTKEKKNGFPGLDFGGPPWAEADCEERSRKEEAGGVTEPATSVTSSARVPRRRLLSRRLPAASAPPATLLPRWGLSCPLRPPQPPPFLSPWPRGDPTRSLVLNTGPQVTELLPRSLLGSRHAGTFQKLRSLLWLLSPWDHFHFGKAPFSFSFFFSPSFPIFGEKVPDL